MTLCLAVPGTAAEMQKCPCQNVTPASYTWNFSAEANRIFQSIQSEAQQALIDADNLDAYARDNEVDWEIQGARLDALREEVNDMSPQLCRLETIRRVVQPWQQKEIDRIKADMLLMADNTRDAIAVGSAHPNALWLQAFQESASNLYFDAHDLVHSVDRAVVYANNLSKGHRNGRAG
jgi:hypothetical protein